MNVIGHTPGDLIPYYIDHTADSVRAVDQCGGTAGDFNLVGCHGINRYGMVGRLGRDVTGALAVLQNKYALASQPPDDRPRRGCSHRTGTDAGQLIQGCRKGCAKILAQFAPGNCAGSMFKVGPSSIILAPHYCYCSRTKYGRGET